MLNYVFSTDCEDIDPKKVSDCTDHELTDQEKKDFEEEIEEEVDDFDACCYATAKIEGVDISRCIPFIKSAAKDGLETDEAKIECEADSNWLSLSLTFLFFGLLF